MYYGYLIAYQVYIPVLSSLHEVITPIDDAYLLDDHSQPVFHDVLITSPFKLKNRYLYDYLSRLNWGDDFFSKIVEQKWKNGLHYMHCSGSSRKKIPTSVKHMNMIFFKKYEYSNLASTTKRLFQ